MLFTSILLIRVNSFICSNLRSVIIGNNFNRATHHVVPWARDMLDSNYERELLKIQNWCELVWWVSDFEIIRYPLNTLEMTTLNLQCGSFLWSFIFSFFLNFFFLMYCMIHTSPLRLRWWCGTLALRARTRYNQIRSLKPSCRCLSLTLLLLRKISFNPESVDSCTCSWEKNLLFC